MHADFNKRHKVSPCSSRQLQHHSCLRIQTIYVTKCPPNAALQVLINSCIYPELKITLTFIFTVLLEIGGKRLDLKGHFVLDVKMGACIYYDSQLSTTVGKFGDKVSALKFPCCQGQLASFPRVTFRVLTSLI